jgi:hypothetical protein
MCHTIGIAAASILGVGVVLLASTGRAQEVRTWSERVPEASNALELGVGGGYTEGFGALTPLHNIQEVAIDGIGLDLNVDYRFDPHFSIGIQGEYQQFVSPTQASVVARGAATNIGLTYHAMPSTYAAPWVRIATGYRMFWSVDPAGGEDTTLIHGLELAKATFGYDLRLARDIAVSPAFGADLTMFVWQDENGVNVPFGPPQLCVFIFGGFQGRFDLGGQRQ